MPYLARKEQRAHHVTSEHYADAIAILNFYAFCRIQPKNRHASLLIYMRFLSNTFMFSVQVIFSQVQVLRNNNLNELNKS